MTGEASENEQQAAAPDPAAIAGQERLAERVQRTGMFGASGSGDTSGYGGLQIRRAPQLPSPRPYGSYFDQVTDALATAMGATGTSYEDAVTLVVVSAEELTLHVQREHLPAVAATLRDEPSLYFEMCLGVSGVHYPADAGAELHAVYNLL